MKIFKLFDFLIECDILNQNYLNIFKIQALVDPIIYSKEEDSMTRTYNLESYLLKLRED